jgi:hypothetical protein
MIVQLSEQIVDCTIQWENRWLHNSLSKFVVIRMLEIICMLDSKLFPVFLQQLITSRWRLDPTGWSAHTRRPAAPPERAGAWPAREKARSMAWQSWSGARADGILFSLWWLIPDQLRWPYNLFSNFRWHSCRAAGVVHGLPIFAFGRQWHGFFFSLAGTCCSRLRWRLVFVGVISWDVLLSMCVLDSICCSVGCHGKVHF